MKYIDTPAGKFQILLNGKPTEFEAQVHSPYTYHNIPITACYEVHLSCNALHIGDIIRVQFEYGNLTCDGGGENRINVVGCIGSYTVGIGAPDTLELTFNHTTHWLPYENVSFDHHGFIFEIIDDPRKYTSHPLQRGIDLIVAWESNVKEYAWDIVSFMTS